jgi:glycosyltransferase involved in cell wall biosynthesis
MARRLQNAFPDKPVSVAPNSTDGTRLLARRKALQIEGRQKVRSRLGLSRTFYIVGLGRLIREKEFHRLISILNQIRQAGLDAGLILIGSGPELERIRQLATVAELIEGRDVVYAGTVGDPETLAEWLYCSDLCINPGDLGLSLVDCLFCGVPVIAAQPGPQGPYHGPEWHYLNDLGGWLVGSNSDVAMAARAIEHLRQTPDYQRRSAQTCIDFASSTLGMAPMLAGLLDLMGRLQRSRSTDS